MTSLRVICGLAPPNQKSWLRLCFGRQTNAIAPAPTSAYTTALHPEGFYIRLS